MKRFETAKSIAAGQAGAIADAEDGPRGRDGKIYTISAPLQSLLMAPVLVVADHLPLSPEKKEGAARLAFNLVVLPAISALTLVLAFQALWCLGFSRPAAYFATLAIGIATPFWHYARSAQEENLVALGYVLWLLGMARFEKEKRGGLILAAVGGSVAFAARWASAVPLAVLGAGSLALLWKKRGSIRWGELAGGVLLCLAVVAGLLAYNAYRFGSPLETGYGLVARHYHIPLISFASAQGNVLTRGVALLFSPYRGLLLYAPALLCLFFLIGKRISLLETCGLLALVAALLLDSSYYFWTAGHSWGPRFLVAPLILLAPLFARFYERFGLPRPAMALIALSVAIQLLSVMLPSNTEEIVRDRHHVSPYPVASAWQCGETPLCLRLPFAVQALRHTVAREPGEILPEGTRSLEDRALESSDYRTIFWWPFRFVFRFGYLSLAAAVGVTVGLLSLAFWLLASAYDWKEVGRRVRQPLMVE